MSTKLEVVSFSAEWCNPCKQFAPIYESVTRALKSDDIQFKKVNIDADPELAQEMGVRGIPTTVIIKDGVKVEHLSGMQTESALSAAIIKHR